MKTMPPSVNFHICAACNMRCRFCFSRFTHNSDRVSGLRVVRLLAAAGFRKITFAGGEPTLCGYLFEALSLARALGMTTTIVTNGSLLTPRTVTRCAHVLDWLGLSVDSAREGAHRELGRAVAGEPLPRGHYEALAASAKAARIRLKVNTVVTRVNVSEDMRALIQRLGPARWKILQALPIRGQNDEGIEKLAVESAAFQGFVARHADLAREGIAVVPETNGDMSGTYAMLDPLGQFIDNSAGEHRYSRSILDVGVRDAWNEVHFDRQAFVRRGGLYEFAPAAR